MCLLPKPFEKPWKSQKNLWKKTAGGSLSGEKRKPKPV